MTGHSGPPKPALTLCPSELPYPQTSGAVQDIPSVISYGDALYSFCAGRGPEGYRYPCWTRHRIYCRSGHGAHAYDNGCRLPCCSQLLPWISCAELIFKFSNTSSATASAFYRKLRPAGTFISVISSRTIRTADNITRRIFVDSRYMLLCITVNHFLLPETRPQLPLLRMPPASR